MSRRPVHRPLRQVGAPVDVMGELHKALAADLAELLRTGKARAAHLSVIRSFLKDNGIRAKGRDGQLAGLDALAAMTIPDFQN